MGELSQDSDQTVHVKVVKPDFSLYYGLFTYLEFGVSDEEAVKA